MAQPLWSFIRNFSNTKFYDAVQQGTLTGAPPFTFGAIFATEAAGGGGTIFGNIAAGPTGFSLARSALLLAATNGTVTQTTGPITDATGALLVDASGDTSAEDLANAYKSSALAGSAVAGVRGSNGPRAVQLVHAALVVPASGNQLFFINGHLVHAIAVGLAASAAKVTIGNNPAHSVAASSSWISGCFYHNAAYTADQMASMFAACARAKDIVGGGYSSAPVPAYMWSVKRGNFDARANWVSDGSAATPITMAQSGIWTPGGIDGDLLAADVPWMNL